MFNAATHTNTAPAAVSSIVFSLIEALLFVNLRDALTADDAAAQVDGAYHYGL